MKFYGIELAQGAQIINTVVERGPHTPIINNSDSVDYQGRLFFNTSDNRLYAWGREGWASLGFYGIPGGYVSSINGQQGNITLDAAVILPLIPKASQTVLGLVKVGAGLSINSSGVLSAAVTTGTGSAIDLSGYALIDSPDFTGAVTSTAPVATSNDTTVATTKFVKDTIAVATATVGRPIIDYVNISGHNCLAVLSDGKLYTTSGTEGSSWCTTSGRFHPQYHNSLGINGLKHVVFPYNSSKIVKTGGYGYVAYALFANGELYTWGYNSYGECGLGHTTVQRYPALAASGVVDVYTHPSNSEYSVVNPKLIIKKSDGYLYAAGYNGYGNLGIGNATAVIPTFTKLTNMGTNPLSVWNMGTHTGCTVVQKSDGTIWVAGYNGYGQLGIGNTTNQSSFVDVTTAWGGPSAGDIVSVHFAGQYYDTGAGQGGTLGILRKIGSTTSFYVCGNGAWGQLGKSSTTNISTPYLIPASTNVKQVAFIGGGPLTVQMLNNDGSLYAWGYNSYGTIGNGATVNLTVPALILNGVSRLLSDGQTTHTYSYRAQAYIIKTDGHLYAAGYDDITDYTGTGASTYVTSFTRVLLPFATRVKWLGNFATTTHGIVHVVVTENDTIYGWGYNGQYGVSQGTNTGYTAPTHYTLQATGE